MDHNVPRAAFRNGSCWRAIKREILRRLGAPAEIAAPMKATLGSIIPALEA
jgi:hypothetical protein